MPIEEWLSLEAAIRKTLTQWLKKIELKYLSEHVNQPSKLQLGGLLTYCPVWSFFLRCFGTEKNI